MHMNTNTRSSSRCPASLRSDRHPVVCFDDANPLALPPPARRLTNTVTLLHLLQKNIKPASGSQFKGGRTATQAMQGARNMLGGLFGRPTPLGGEASIHGGGVGGFR